MICHLGATELIWIYMEAENPSLVANISVAFLSASLFLWERFPADVHGESPTSSQWK